MIFIFLEFTGLSGQIPDVSILSFVAKLCNFKSAFWQGIISVNEMCFPSLEFELDSLGRLVEEHPLRSVLSSHALQRRHTH